jgi:hypothetical protein
MLPPGSRTRAVISGAASLIGWTSVLPWATALSIVAAALSTITYRMHPGASALGRLMT